MTKKIVQFKEQLTFLHELLLQKWQREQASMHGEIKKQARLSEWLQSCPFTQKKTDVYLGGKRQREHLMEVTR